VWGTFPSGDGRSSPWIARRSSATVVRVARVLMTWNRPYHLSDSEAAAWILSEARRLRELAGVERVTLTRVAATERHARPWDWVCELHLRAGVDAGECVNDAAFGEWVRDLHLLGMHPKVALLEATEAVG
jgi:class 3 adenylate cyclase